MSTVELSSAKLATILQCITLSGGGGGDCEGEERVAAFKAIKSKNGRFVHSCPNELLYDCSYVNYS